ncbi:hypothetical protein DNTS_032667 [Danionella cerebrum]|uniref:Pyroglutamyl-peptidase I n=1 Tax=Danionella cerebrum TaxID=2873325 RepID=A0A553MPS2_9TELE|nr:hypothetical protein DNTS_032667 [Danionella translucida]
MEQKKTVVVTGFEPFGEYTVNASWVAVQLVVHVGVSGIASSVTLEQCAHNQGYQREDNCCYCPRTHCCVEGGPDCIPSVLQMHELMSRVDQSALGVAVSVSEDAGRYLCDYTYYLSLYEGAGRSVFVHVPPLGKPYSAEELARALRALILEMLELLETQTGPKSC